MMNPFKKTDVKQAATAIIILGLSALVVLLAYQNQRLKSRLETLLKPPEMLKVGDTTQTAHLLTIAGEGLDMRFGGNGGGSIFFTFSTTCPSCEKSLGLWERIADSATNHGVNVYSISLHDTARTRAYQLAHNLRHRVYIVRDTTFKMDFKIAYVPTTVLVDSQRVVRAVWTGLIDSTRSREILDKIRRANAR